MQSQLPLSVTPACCLLQPCHTLAPLVLPRFYLDGRCEGYCCTVLLLQMQTESFQNTSFLHFFWPCDFCVVKGPENKLVSGTVFRGIEEMKLYCN